MLPFVRCIGVVLMAAVSVSSQANSNNIEAKVYVSGFTEDNYGLRRGRDKNDVTGSEQRVTISAASDTGTTTYSVGVDLTNQDINAKDQMEDDQFNAYAGIDYLTEKSQLGLDVRYEQDTTLSDEFLTQSNQFIRQDLERYRSSFATSYVWMPSETWYWNVSLYGEDLQFENDPSRLLAYRYYAASIQPNWMFHEQASVFFSLSKTLVDYEDKTEADVIPLNANRYPDTVDTISLSAGGRYQMVERLNLEASIGYRQTSYKNVDIYRAFDFSTFQMVWITQEHSSEGNGLVYDISLSYAGEQSDTRFGASQSTTPNSVGDVFSEKSVIGLYRYKHSNTVITEVDAEYVEQRSDLEADMSGDQNSTYIRARLYWNFYRNLSFYAKYRYLMRKVLIADDVTESNKLSFGLRWATDTRFW